MSVTSRLSGAVSLPMYDLPFMKGATEAFWQALQPYLTEAGFQVSWRGGCDGRAEAAPEALWLDEALTLSQTCLYPFGTTLKNRVKLVATPQYWSSECHGPYYRNLILMHKSNMRSLAEIKPTDIFAFNDSASYSGYASLYRTRRANGMAFGAPAAFFKRVCSTGGHLNSMEMVAEGLADLCSVDCVTYALCEKYAPDRVAELNIVARGPHAPGLPLITRGSATDDDISALRAAFRAFSEAENTQIARHAVLWSGLSCLDLNEYDDAMIACGS